MRISIRARYALRASLALAKLGNNDTLVSINTLSEAEGISPVFLEQIFFKMRNAGILHSVRGPGGGFAFSRPLDHLTVKDILEAAGEDFTLTNCDKSLEGCDRVGTCISHTVWQGAHAVVYNYLGSLTIAALLEKHTSQSKGRSRSRKSES